MNVALKRLGTERSLHSTPAVEAAARRRAINFTPFAPTPHIRASGRDGVNWLTFVVTMQRQSMAERRQVEMYPNPRSPLSPLSLQLLSFSLSLSQRPPFAPLFFSVSLLTDLSIEENRVWREGGGNVKRKGEGRRERE